MMKKREKIAALMLGAVLALMPLVASAAPYDYIVDRVSQASYSSYLNGLFTGNGDNRGLGGADHDAARTSISNYFQSFGLTTSLDPFTYGGKTYYNVVGVLEGKTTSNEIHVIGAHYDSYNSPGADDNASGTAGILEAARVLSQFHFADTLVFVAFDREEQGLKGSYDYAYDHRTDNIQGMISLDMIAYNHGNHANIYGSTASNPLKYDLADAIADYGNGIGITVGGSLPYSDHYPFELQGFDACVLIEDYTSNPYYHTSYDSVDTSGYIDYAFATGLTRSTVGYLAEAAGVVPVPAPASIYLLSFGLVLISITSGIRKTSQGLIVKLKAET